MYSIAATTADSPWRGNNTPELQSINLPLQWEVFRLSDGLVVSLVDEFHFFVRFGESYVPHEQYKSCKDNTSSND